MDPLTMAAIGAGVGGLQSLFGNSAQNEANKAANEKARIDALNFAWTGKMPGHVPQETDEWGNLLGGITGGAMSGASFGLANPDLFATEGAMGGAGGNWEQGYKGPSSVASDYNTQAWNDVLATDAAFDTFQKQYEANMLPMIGPRI